MPKIKLGFTAVGVRHCCPVFHGLHKPPLSPHADIARIDYPATWNRSSGVGADVRAITLFCSETSKEVRLWSGLFQSGRDDGGGNGDGAF